MRHDDGANLHTLLRGGPGADRASPAPRRPRSPCIWPSGATRPATFRSCPASTCRGRCSTWIPTRSSPSRSIHRCCSRSARRASGRSGAPPYTTYADPEALLEEIRQARRLYRAQGWQVVDISGRAAEENAARILPPRRGRELVKRGPEGRAGARRSRSGVGRVKRGPEGRARSEAKPKRSRASQARPGGPRAERGEAEAESGESSAARRAARGARRSRSGVGRVKRGPEGRARSEAKPKRSRASQARPGGPRAERGEAEAESGESSAARRAARGARRSRSGVGRVKRGPEGRARSEARSPDPAGLSRDSGSGTPPVSPRDPRDGARDRRVADLP